MLKIFITVYCPSYAGQSASHRIGMYRDTLDAFLHSGFVVLYVDGHLFQFVQGVESVDNASEQRVFEIQLWLGSVGKEELARVRSRPVVGHGDHAPFVVFQVLLQLVLEFASVYRLATLSGAGRVTCLYNESFDVPMKQASVVVVAGAKSEEVLTGFRTFVTKEFDFYVPSVCV